MKRHVTLIILMASLWAGYLQAQTSTLYLGNRTGCDANVTVTFGCGPLLQDQTIFLDANTGAGTINFNSSAEVCTVIVDFIGVGGAIDGIVYSNQCAPCNGTDSFGGPCITGTMYLDPVTLRFGMY
jgi:hypothetical protein